MAFLFLSSFSSSPPFSFFFVVVVVAFKEGNWPTQHLSSFPTTMGCLSLSARRRRLKIQKQKNPARVQRKRVRTWPGRILDTRLRKRHARMATNATKKKGGSFLLSLLMSHFIYSHPLLSSALSPSLSPPLSSTTTKEKLAKKSWLWPLLFFSLPLCSSSTILPFFLPSFSFPFPAFIFHFF